MPELVDIFSDKAFSAVSMTEAINKLPYQPSRLGKLGLFARKGIPTTTAVIEERDGKLSLLQTKSRGETGEVYSSGRRRVRSFNVPHIPFDDAVLAADIQNVRQFGSNNLITGVSQVINQRMGEMRQSHEVTHEWHRLGAVKGQILDADGSILYDLFSAFGITQKTITLDFSAADSIRLASLEAIRHIEDNLGAMTYRNVRALCGTSFMDNLLTDDEAKTAWERAQDGQFLREVEAQRRGFMFNNIMWEEYRGKVGGQQFVAANKAYLFAEGVRGLFVMYDAPGNFMEAVNTLGKPTYAKQEVKRFNVGVDIHTESNPLALCTRPETLVEVTHT